MAETLGAAFMQPLLMGAELDAQTMANQVNRETLQDTIRGKRASVDNILAETALRQAQAEQAQINTQKIKKAMADYALAQEIWRRTHSGGGTSAPPAPGGATSIATPPPGAAPGTAPSPAPVSPSGPVPPSGGSSPVDPMAAIEQSFTADIGQRVGYANALSQAGLFEESQKIMMGAFADSAKFEQMIASRANANKSRTDAAAKQAEYVHGITSGIVDPKSYDAARMQFLSDNPGKPLPGWMRLPYDQAKPIIDQIREKSKEGLAIIKARADIDKTKADTAVSRANKRLREAQANIEEMEQRAGADAQARAEKEGKAIPSVKHLAKSGQQVSAIERTYAQQSIMAGNEVAAGLDMILKLPIGTGMGTFSDLAYSHDPSFIGGAKKWFANKLTPEENQKYASRLAGVNIAATTIAMGGRPPRQTQMKAEQDAIAQLSGQSRENALDKIIVAATKALRGIEFVRGDEWQMQQVEIIKQKLQQVIDDGEAALHNLKTDGVPDGLPKGTKFIGYSKDDAHRPVFEDPSGKKWVQ